MKVYREAAMRRPTAPQGFMGSILNSFSLGGIHVVPNPDKPEKKTFNHDGDNRAQPCKEHRPGGKS
jgi:hypothetical protein